MSLLTMKPVIYAANVAEDDFITGINQNAYVQQLCMLAEKEGAEVLPISARIEEEISQLEPEDKKMFLEDMGLEESGLDRLIRASYKPVSYTHLSTAFFILSQSETVSAKTFSVKICFFALAA